MYRLCYCCYLHDIAYDDANVCVKCLYELCARLLSLILYRGDDNGHGGLELIWPCVNSRMCDLSNAEMKLVVFKCFLLRIYFDQFMHFVDISSLDSLV